MQLAAPRTQHSADGLGYDEENPFDPKQLRQLHRLRLVLRVFSDRLVIHELGNQFVQLIKLAGSNRRVCYGWKMFIEATAATS